MGTAAKLWETYTYADFKNWPDDERWELIDGVAWDMSPAPNVNHQRISRELSGLLYNYLKGRKCELFTAPFDVFLPDFSGQEMNDLRTMVEPDLAVICDKSKIIKQGCLGAPDLVVEILSPYTSKKDLNEKFRKYEQSGVGEYWAVDPGSRALQQYVLDEQGRYGRGQVFESEGVVHSAVLDGFSLNLSDLFSVLT